MKISEWAIGLAGVVVGLVFGEVFAYLREGRANRREMLLRRYETQLAGLEGIAHAVAAVRANKRPPAETVVLVQRAFGRTAGDRIRDILQRMLDVADFNKKIDFGEERVIQDGVEFAAQLDTIHQVIQRSEEALGAPAFSEGEALFQKALAAEERRLAEAKRPIEESGKQAG